MHKSYEKEDNTFPQKNNFFNELVSKIAKVKYFPITSEGVGTDKVEVNSTDTGINLGEDSINDNSNMQNVITVVMGLAIAGILYKVTKN